MAPEPAPVAPAKDKPKEQPKQQAEELRRGQVVSFVHRDKLPGVSATVERMGVVLAVGESPDDRVVIRPVADHNVAVDPADVLGIYGAED